MKAFTLKTKYIENYSLKYDLGEEELAPQTYAMYWCMLATGVNRIFTKGHLREFLVRLAITMDVVELVENWFGWGKLLTFTFDDQYYALTADDVFLHIGIDSLDTYIDSISRERYYESIGRLIGQAQLISHFGGGFHVIRPVRLIEEEEDEMDTYLISFSNASIILSDDLIEKAEFFADDILKLLDESRINLTPLMKERLKELKNRKTIAESLPVFDLEKIPMEVRGKCFHLMFNEEYANYLINEAPEDEYQEEAHKYLHLAWLVANDFIWEDTDFDFGQQEGVVFDPELYVDETGWFKITQFVDEYNILACKPLLKGVGV